MAVTLPLRREQTREGIGWREEATARWRRLEPMVQAAQRARQTATNNETAVQADHAWVDLLVAQRHLMLVQRFENESAAYRTLSYRLSGAPGQSQRAEAMRLMASRLHAIAERHRQAAEQYAAEGEPILAEVYGMEKRAREAREARRPPAPPGPPAQRPQHPAPPARPAPPGPPPGPPPAPPMAAMAPAPPPEPQPAPVRPQAPARQPPTRGRATPPPRRGGNE